MQKAFHVWNELCSDALAQERFWRDPEGYARQAGLDEEALQLLLQRNGTQALEVAGIPWAPASFLCDPGEDPLPDPDPPSPGLTP